MSFYSFFFSAFICLLVCFVFPPAFLLSLYLCVFPSVFRSVCISLSLPVRFYLSVCLSLPPLSHLRQPPFTFSHVLSFFLSPPPLPSSFHPFAALADFLRSEQCSDLIASWVDGGRGVGGGGGGVKKKEEEKKKKSGDVYRAAIYLNARTMPDKKSYAEPCRALQRVPETCVCVLGGGGRGEGGGLTWR